MNTPRTKELIMSPNFIRGILLTALVVTPLSGSEMSLPPPAASAKQTKPLQVGQVVPEANFLTPDGDSVSLREMYRQRPLILVFFRGGWCPYCNAQLHKLSGVEEELRTLGYGVFGISPDQPEFLRRSREEHGLKYGLLSDHRLEALLRFGIGFKLEEQAVDHLKDHGMDVEAHAGGSHHVLPVPSVFLVDREGVIRFAYSNPDYKIRLDPGELVNAAKRHRP